MNLDLNFYARIFLRRAPYFLALLALFTSIGITIALILPAEYEARARLLVEQAQIPTNLAASTVQTAASEQLQIIEQRLMTRENLLDIANRLEIYARAEDGGPTMTASAIVEDMRARTTFLTTGAAQVRGQPPTATILTVAFSAENPRKAAEVTNEFVTLVLQENVGLRTEQAGDTLSFFEQEVARLGAELDTHSARLLDFQNRAGIALPANLQFLRGRLTTLEDRRDQRTRELAALADQKQRISDLFNATGGVTQSTPASPLQQQLATAREQLRDAQLIYSDTNPKLLLQQNRVEQLERQVAEQLAASTGSDAANVASQQQTLFQSQIDDIDAQIALLEEELAAIANEIEVVEAQIADTASNGITFAKLQRDFDNVQGQYNEAVGRLSAAATGERIELLSKGQRITVIEQATPPETPTKPNRELIALSGVGAGAAAGLGLIVLLELLNRSIRRPIELTSRLGITPLAVVPYIRTEREIMLKRASFAAVIAIVLFGVPGVLYSVHTFVTPLDALAEPYLNRVGISIAG